MISVLHIPKIATVYKTLGGTSLVKLQPRTWPINIRQYLPSTYPVAPEVENGMPDLPQEDPRPP